MKIIKNAINTRVALVAVIAASSMLTGCASIVSGTNQVVSVETRNGQGPVVGAACKLDNGKGVYFVTTPGTVTVHRAYDNMTVKCEKENLEPGVASIPSATKGMAFGNILAGGIIGAAVDAGSGAAYDYPNLITVLMGEKPGFSATPPAPTAAPTPAAGQVSMENPSTGKTQ
jgi:hypothetical protein